MSNLQGIKNGFTLIELSIVLVITGLITGSIMMGQNLIKAAEIKAQISQIETFTTSANTFTEKYGYLPGDIPARYATKFNFTARTGVAGDGDGNGLLDGCYYSSATTERFGCETALFWRDLSDANLVAGNFSSLTDGYNTITSTSNPLPKATIGNGNYIAVFTGEGNPGNGLYYGEAGDNYFYLAGIISTTATYYDYYTSPSITPIQAKSIDSKVDDGMPQSGKILTATNASSGANGIVYDQNYSIGNCAASSSIYNTSSSNSNAYLCELVFKF